MQFVSVGYCFAYTTLFPLVRWVDLTFVHFRGHSGCHSFPHDLSLQHFGAQVVFDVMSGPGKSMLTACGHLVYGGLGGQKQKASGRGEAPPAANAEGAFAFSRFPKGFFGFLI